MDKIKLKEKATELRYKGKTYTQIQKELRVKIPKSTLSYWFKDVVLSKKAKEKIKEIILNNAKKGREIALITNRKKREEYLKSITDRNKHLITILENKDVAKIALAMLYLGEGLKYRGGPLMFGNSDPFIITLFLRLLRYCYNINESKFRCTLQCRADQDIRMLENFWSQVTKIPPSQFYKARVDPRTIGKPSKKPNYKGVCRIDYFSTDLFLELMEIPKTVHKINN